MKSINGDCYHGFLSQDNHPNYPITWETKISRFLENFLFWYLCAGSSFHLECFPCKNVLLSNLCLLHSYLLLKVSLSFLLLCSHPFIVCISFWMVIMSPSPSCQVFIGLDYALIYFFYISTFLVSTFLRQLVLNCQEFGDGTYGMKKSLCDSLQGCWLLRS